MRGGWGTPQVLWGSMTPRNIFHQLITSDLCLDHLKSSPRSGISGCRTSRPFFGPRHHCSPLFLIRDWRSHLDTKIYAAFSERVCGSVVWWMQIVADRWRNAPEPGSQTLYASYFSPYHRRCRDLPHSTLTNIRARPKSGPIWSQVYVWSPLCYIWHVERGRCHATSQDELNGPTMGQVYILQKFSSHTSLHRIKYFIHHSIRFPVLWTILSDTLL